MLSFLISSTTGMEQRRVTRSLPVQGVCLCVCNQYAYADNYTDVVDQLLIDIIREELSA